MEAEQCWTGAAAAAIIYSMMKNCSLHTKETI